MTTAEFIKCSQCVYREDCENKESREGCYCGEVLEEDGKTSVRTTNRKN